MEAYIYNSKEDYLKHIKELKEKGISWAFNNPESKYSTYYDEYEDFALFIEDDCLSYGTVRWAYDDGVEPILYAGKKSNRELY